MRIVKPYTANLFDCSGIRGADQADAENAYCAAIEQFLGGADKVVPAYQEFMKVFEKYESIPIPKEATEDENSAITRWFDADSAGRSAAFEGWHRSPDSAHFSITF